MEVGRKAVTLYLEKRSWPFKSSLEGVLTIELLPEGRMRVLRRIGIGMKGIPDKIVNDQNLRDGPVEVEVVRGERGDAAIEVYVAQIQEHANGGAIWVVSTIRDRLVFSGKSERGDMARELVSQAMAALGTHPRTSSSFIPSERLVPGAPEGAEPEPEAPRAKRARTQTTAQAE